MPCFLSILQSPIQAFLRPAVWIPGLSRLHSHREQWVSMSGTADKLVDELIQAVDVVAEADPQTTYQVKKVDRDKHRVQIYNWTRAEWLDVVEIQFRDGANGVVEAKCFSFSSGFLPTWFPLCFIFNVIFFFFPFYDNKFNSIRLERLRVSMVTECQLVPKKTQASDETTPIMPKDTPTPSRPRHGSCPSPIEHYQEATPTKSDTEPVTTEVRPETRPPEDTSVPTPSIVDKEPDSPTSSAEPVMA